MNMLLALTVGGSALALLLLVLRYFILRRMPSTVYYYAWLLVLLRFALPFPGLIPTAREAAEPSNVHIEAAYDPGVHEQDLILLSPDAAFYPVPVFPAGAQEPVQSGELPETAVTQTAAPAGKTELTAFRRSPAVWITVWALGAGVSLGLTVFSYLRFTHRLRRELRGPDRFTRELYDSIPGRKPALFRSAAVRTPLMYGVFAPRIVLPKRFCEEKILRNILRHELMHYRRFDMLYKWAAVAVLSAHWFNPLSWLIRRELNRACELSCDEMLLRSMDRAEKQSYGDTLLSMAASAVLPDRVVATTFVTEKRNLKERLEQIMKYKKSGARLLASVLAIALLAGGALAAGPRTRAAEPASDRTREIVRVSDVDGFLAAIGPDTVIELAEGGYDLSDAADYGKESQSPYYRWEAVPGSGPETQAQLVIDGVENLTLRGAGKEKTIVAAEPRYANVIRFLACTGLRVEDLTAGHTTEPGFCAGGVLRLENCDDVQIKACGLFGCGTVGVDASDTAGLDVIDCHIFECSYNAVSLTRCRASHVENCEIYRHGTREGQGAAMGVFNVNYCSGVTICRNSIFDNNSQFLLNLNYTRDAVFFSNDVHGNRFDAAVFQFAQYGAAVDGCAFTDNAVRNWVQSSGVYAWNAEGKLLDAGDFASMTLRDIDPDTAVTPDPVTPAAEVDPGGEIMVSTVDELLAAIGPERTIILNGNHLFDLSKASNYGAVGGEYYYWQESHDGPQLVISGADGLTIRAAGESPEDTTLSALPRYANVLRFRDCGDLTLENFTAGHTEEPGACSGGVLDFTGCGNVRLKDMRLYGCGILGIQASGCKSMEILDTEIFECSQGAVKLFGCRDVHFDDCDIHDVPSPALAFQECTDVVWNEEPCDGLTGRYDVSADGALTFLSEPTGEAELFQAELYTPTYPEGAPERAFAEMVRTAVADGDWESLSDWIAFPLKVVDGEGRSLQIPDKASFLARADGLFNKEFRETVANASMDEYGATLYGVTFCRHLLAFSSYYSSEKNGVEYRVMVMSVSKPLWPGQFPYVQAAPTPAA